jgi:hypothetical protein
MIVEKNKLSYDAPATVSGRCYQTLMAFGPQSCVLLQDRNQLRVTPKQERATRRVAPTNGWCGLLSNPSAFGPQSSVLHQDRNQLRVSPKQERATRQVAPTNGWCGYFVLAQQKWCPLPRSAVLDQALTASPTQITTAAAMSREWVRLTDQVLNPWARAMALARPERRRMGFPEG